jgi:GNAT superfamily N-acetyltransferase
VIEYRTAAVDKYAVAAMLRQQMSAEMGGNYDKDYPGWRERYVVYLGNRQSQGQAQLFLAHDADVVVGMVIVSLEDAYRFRIFGRRIANINGTYVVPTHRRRGIAKQLMDLAIEWARQQKCTIVRLRTSEEGRPLYNNLGFKPSPEMQMEL